MCGWYCAALCSVIQQIHSHFAASAALRYCNCVLFFFLVVVVVDLLCFWSAFVVTAHVLVSFEWVRETRPHDNRRNKRPAQSTCGGAHTSHSSRQPRIYRIPRTAANLVRRSFTAEKMSKTLNELRLHNVNVKKDGEWQVEVLCADNKVKLSFA